MYSLDRVSLSSFRLGNVSDGSKEYQNTHFTLNILFFWKIGRL